MVIFLATEAIGVGVTTEACWLSLMRIVGEEKVKFLALKVIHPLRS